MAAPYKQEFKINGMHLTTVVMDKGDFDTLCEGLTDVFDKQSGSRVDDSHITTLKKADHIPLMQKGTKTERIFKEFDIATNYASFIVRGTARRMLS